MKHILFFLYIFAFIVGVGAYLNMLFIYLKTRNINLKNYLSVFGFFFIMSILSAVFIYIEANLHGKNETVMKCILALTFIIEGIFVYDLFSLIAGLFKLPFTKIRRIFLITFSFSPIAFFFIALIFLNSFSALMKAVDMWAIGFSILIAIVFLNFIMKHKKYYLRLEDEETKKMVKAGFLLYSFLLFSQITVETLAFFGYTIYFYTDGDFGIFVIINSAICLYFSIRFYMNKMVLSTSETITESFLEKYLITPREKEVIEKLIIGLSNKEIGESMDITEGTVKVFVYNIYQKVGVKNRMSLARIAKSEIN